MTKIVTLNVSLQVAPLPETLQSSVALISQGGTTLSGSTYKYLTQLSDLTSILSAPITLASVSQSGGTATATLPSVSVSSGTYNSTTGLVTLTLASNIGILPGYSVTISSATGTGSYSSINGTFTAGSGTSGTTLTYTIATSLTMTITGGSAQLDLINANGAQFLTTVAGATPSAYNGTVLATVASASTFTYSVPSATATPATGTITYTPSNQAELVQMATTFFAQGSQIGCYVLELGPGTPTTGISTLSAYLTANPNSDYVPGAQGYFYAYCVPRLWDAVSSFLTLLTQYDGDTAMTYFLVTTTTTNYTSYTDLMKDAMCFVQAPNTTAAEFDAAATLYQIAVRSPSNVNLVTPFCYDYLAGVTAYPTQGNGSLLQSLANASVNVVGTGAEGGITNTILVYGQTMDGNDFKFWYSVDWAILNVDLNLANAIINGSNNQVNPLLYNQQGINRLQGVAQQVMNDGVAFGMVLSTNAQVLNTGQQVQASPTVNAVPFVTYVQDNPSDYENEVYKGFSCTFTPQNGFRHITFNMAVSEFPLGGP